LQTGKIVVDDGCYDLATMDGVEGDIVATPSQPDVKLGPSGVIGAQVSGGAIRVPLGRVCSEAVAVKESAFHAMPSTLIEVGAGNTDLPSVFEINHHVVVRHGQHCASGTVFDEALAVTPNGAKVAVGDLGNDLVAGAEAGSPS
jgi:hypothetical protein